jgi:hypothetical protein
VETFACPSHSSTLAISASFESAFVAAVARIECTHTPMASPLMPVAFAQSPHLGIAERRRTSLIVIRGGPLHAVNRIAEDRVALTELVEQRGKR